MISATSFGQTIKVTSGEEGEPIENVNIINASGKKKVTTNAKGTFDIGVFGVKDTLIISHAAFRKKTLTFEEVRNMGSIALELDVIMLDPYTFSDSRVKEEQQPITRKIEVISSKKIAFNNPQTAADALEADGEVYIQKSQMGGGSPIIRGFEANRVLLVIDGVRMNNAIYRNGHLQNAITVDPSMLERAEVFFGPGSVIYGSDALGGVVHYYTKDPVYAEAKDSMIVQMNVFSRYASANNEATAHVDFTLGGNRWSSLTSLSFSEFQDLRSGTFRDANYEDFGAATFHVTTIGGVDSMVANEDDRLQVGTAYGQLDAMQKLRYKFNDSLEMSLNLQMSRSSDIPRYDQLSLMSNGRPKWAEWYYGPQQRYFGSLKTTIRAGNALFNRLNIILSAQKIDEDRINRAFGDSMRTVRNEDVFVYGFNADFVKDFGGSNMILQYGLEGYYNDVKSIAFTEHITADPPRLGSAIERYPDGGSNMLTASAYITLKKEWDKHILYLGTRYSRTMLEANFIDTTFYTLPFTSIQNDNGAITGSINYVFKPTDSWRINATAGSAFRNPNIDDIGKVREKNGLVLVPNDGLTPEYAYTGELGITKGFGGNRLRINAIGFYTYLVDAIVRRNHQLNGQDSLQIDGVMAKIQTNRNAALGYVYGASAKVIWNPTKELELISTGTYTVGRSITYNAPLGHIPPIYGRTAVNYTLAEGIRTSFYVNYNAWKHIWDYSTTGEDNEDFATVDGTPAWYTLNINTEWSLSDRLRLQIGIQNLLDVHYRRFASGVSAPGRNIVVTVRGEL